VNEGHLAGRLDVSTNPRLCCCLMVLAGLLPLVAPLEGQRALECRAIRGLGVRREHDVDGQVEQRA
jgi:hypothetical protein